MYVSIHVLGSQLAPVWVKKMVVYSHWTGTSGLEWWTGMVELLICSFGVQRCAEPNPLYTALEGPQAASADSRQPKTGPRQLQTGPRWPSDGTSYLHMAPDGPQTATASARWLQTDQDGGRLFQKGPMLLQTGPRRLSASVRRHQIATEYRPPLNPSLHLSIHCSTVPVHHSSPLILVQ